ncbi:MAG: hypothetical protein H7844_06010 [Nitrospirae bacterium YQR-1]
MIKSDSFLNFKELAIVLALCVITFSLANHIKDSNRSNYAGYGSDADAFIDLARNYKIFGDLKFSPHMGYHSIPVNVESRSYTDGMTYLHTYPLLMSGISYATGGDMIKAAHVINIFVFLLISLSVFVSLKIFYKEECSERNWILFTIYIIYNPSFIVFLAGIGIDLVMAGLMSFLFMLILMLTLLESLKRSVFLLVVTGLVVYSFLLCFGRNNMVAYLLPIFVLLSVYSGVKKNNRNAVVFVLVILIILMSFSLQVLRMKRLTGEYVNSVNDGSAIFLNYVYYEIDKSDTKYYRWKEPAYTGELFLQLLKEGKTVNEAQLALSRGYKIVTYAYIKEHPDKFRKVLYDNMKRIFTGRDYYWFPAVFLIKKSDVPDVIKKYHKEYPDMAYKNWKMKLIYELSDFIYYTIFCLIPFYSLMIVMLFYIYKLIKSGFAAVSSRETVLFIFSISTVVFLVATAHYLAMARYRLPAFIPFFLCVLCSADYVIQLVGRVRGGSTVLLTKR